MTARGHGNDGESPGTPATWPRAEERCTNSLAGLCLSALIGRWRARRAVKGLGNRPRWLMSNARSTLRPKRQPSGRAAPPDRPPALPALGAGAPRVKGRQMAGKLPSRTRGRPLSWPSS